MFRVKSKTPWAFFYMMILAHYTTFVGDLITMKTTFFIHLSFDSVQAFFEIKLLFELTPSLCLCIHAV